jgi:hypothetical protein
LSGQADRESADAEELHSLRQKVSALESTCVAMTRDLEAASSESEEGGRRAGEAAQRAETVQEELADVRRAREVLADELARYKAENLRLTETLDRQALELDAMEAEVLRLMKQASESAPPPTMAESPAPPASGLDSGDLRQLIDQVRDLTKMLRQPAPDHRTHREVLEPDDVLPPDDPPTIEDWREPIQRELSPEEPEETLEVAHWRPADDEESVVEESLPPVQNDPHLVIAETFLLRAADAQEGLNWPDLFKRYWFIGLLAVSIVAFLAWLIPVLISNVAPLAF